MSRALVVVCAALAFLSAALTLPDTWRWLSSQHSELRELTPVDRYQAAGFNNRLPVGGFDFFRTHVRRGDRVFDVGRMVGELQHSFMVATGRKSRAEPFISYFFHEYSSHFPKPGAAFASITARAPFYMGLNHLRIARNDYVTESYGARLVRQAKRLLRAS